MTASMSDWHPVENVLQTQSARAMFFKSQEFDSNNMDLTYIMSKLTHSKSVLDTA